MTFISDCRWSLLPEEEEEEGEGESQMLHAVDTGPARLEQYHLLNGLKDRASGDRRLLSFCLISHFSFIPPLLLPCPLFILMWSGRSSWWWHGVDYAVPTVTDSKAAKEGTIVAFDLWVTALPVAPAPHWRAHGARRAGRSGMDQTGRVGPWLCFWAEIYTK